MSSDYVLEIKTVQATTFKQVVDALKEILMDVNLEFDESGMKVVALDSSHTVLVHLKLNADSFEEYKCEQKTYVGINMLKLHMLIKTVGNNDMLTLFIDREDTNHLGIRIENPLKNLRTTFKLAMFDIDVLNIAIPPADFETVIQMPSVDFQKIIREAHNLAELIEISNVGNQITFKCKGDFCSQETIIGADKNDNIHITKSSGTAQEIIQGVFALKYLANFTKCSGLSPTVDIHLKNSFPIVLRYGVASLGFISLCLSQVEDSS